MGTHSKRGNGSKKPTGNQPSGTHGSAANGLGAISHIVVLVLENRSFDHMLGFLYADANNVSPAGQPFEGLTGTESNPDSANGASVVVSRIQPALANTSATRSSRRSRRAGTMRLNCVRAWRPKYAIAFKN